MSSNQPKPAPEFRGSPEQFHGDTYDPRKDKPASGEWTKQNMAGKWSRGEDWIINAHNAAVKEAYNKGHDDGYAEAGNGLGY